MNNATKEIALRNKKKLIFDLLDKNDPVVVHAIMFLETHFLIIDQVKHTDYSTPFHYVFKERLVLPRWKLAELCNLSEKSMSRRENEIVDSFFFFIKQKLIINFNS